MIATRNGFYLHRSVVGQQFDIMYSFARSYIYYGKLNALLERAGARDAKTCIIHTHNCHVFNAASEWCKIFGDERRNKVHYRKTPKQMNSNNESVREQHVRFRRQAKDAIKSSLSFSNSELTGYTRSVLAFCNKYVAHCDLGEFPPVPFMENAYTVMCAYNEFLVDMIPWGDERQKTLEELSQSFDAEAEALTGLVPANN